MFLYHIFCFYRWKDLTIDRLKASKTIWPIPQIEQVFLPDFKIKSQINEYSFKVPILIKNLFNKF